jgi:hypothetical protein
MRLCAAVYPLIAIVYPRIMTVYPLNEKEQAAMRLCAADATPPLAALPPSDRPPIRRCYPIAAATRRYATARRCCPPGGGPLWCPARPQTSVLVVEGGRGGGAAADVAELKEADERAKQLDNMGAPPLFSAPCAVTSLLEPFSLATSLLTRS